MTSTFKLVEDNGGGLRIFIFAGGRVVSGVDGLEYAEAGEWNMVRDDMMTDPAGAILTWYGHQMEEPEAAYADITSHPCGWEVVADSQGSYPQRMGIAARRYFGVED